MSDVIDEERTCGECEHFERTCDPDYPIHCDMSIRYAFAMRSDAPICEFMLANWRGVRAINAAMKLVKETG
jgi:hypothetical protein